MKSHKSKFFILGTLFGVFLTLSAIAVYLNAPAKISKAKELSVDNAISKIENKEIKEAYFKDSQVDWIDREGNRYFTYLGSDSTRESLLGELKTFNVENSAQQIKVAEEPQSSGLYLLIIINALPFVILAVCLILTVYWVTKSKSGEIK